MGNHALFASLAFAVSAGAYFPYVRNIATGRTRPTLSSWISWWILDTAILVSIIAAGGMSWQMVAYAGGTCVVLGVCVYKKAALGWTAADSFCIGMVIGAMLMWYYSSNPQIGMLLCLLAALIGSFPFIRNVRKTPHAEAILPWIMAAVGSVCQLLSIEQWSFSEIVTPVVWLMVQLPAVWYISQRYWRTATI